MLEAAATRWPLAERDKGLCLARLANAYVAAREPDKACAAASEALAVMAVASSQRTAGTLRELRGRLVPYRRRPDVMDLRAELAVAV